MFIAREIPAMGYSIFHVVPRSDATPDSIPTPTEEDASASRKDEATIENRLIRARLNLWTGELRSVVMKDDGWEALKGSGNVVAREEDGGDFVGAVRHAERREIFPAMTRKSSLKPERTILSSEAVGGSGHRKRACLR